MSIIIAIGGGSGSGKSLLAAALKEKLGPIASSFSYDSYYLDQSDMSYEERLKTNYDSPSSLDEKLFIKHLEAIKKNEAIDIPVYDFVTLNRKAGECLHFVPTPIVIVEGILTLNIEKADSLYDYTIFMKSDSDIRLSRRIIRDVKERGRSPEGIIKQYLATVRPMHLKYVEPCRYEAKFIFTNNDDNGLDEEELAVLVAKIRRILGKHDN